jgi:hypothetical protein
MTESVTDRPTKSHEYLFLLTKSASYFYDAEAIKEHYAECTVNDSRVGVDFSRGGIKDYEGNGVQNPSDVRARIFNNLGTGRNKRSVWTVATAPYPEAHFATYPPDLIKPCIMAGTSAKGCCGKCGSPWERIVERGPDGTNDGRRRPSPANGFAHIQTNHPRLKGNLVANFSTLGWQPTCVCHWEYRMEPVPCTVLDPFAGSGTTGAVALELGRKAIWIELNPKYVELIEERCTTTIGLALAC